MAEGNITQIGSNVASSSAHALTDIGQAIQTNALKARHLLEAMEDVLHDGEPECGKPLPVESLDRLSYFSEIARDLMNVTRDLGEQVEVYDYRSKHPPRQAVETVSN